MSEVSHCKWHRFIQRRLAKAWKSWRGRTYSSPGLARCLRQSGEGSVRLVVFVSVFVKTASLVGWINFSLQITPVCWSFLITRIHTGLSVTCWRDLQHLFRAITKQRYILFSKWSASPYFSFSFWLCLAQNVGSTSLSTILVKCSIIFIALWDEIVILLWTLITFDFLSDVNISYLRTRLQRCMLGIWFVLLTGLIPYVNLSFWSRNFLRVNALDV